MSYVSLSHEVEIVWDVDPTTLPYVRASIAFTTRRRGPLRDMDTPAGRRVGYANLRPDAPSSSPYRWERRVFWLKDHDRGESSDNGSYTPSGCPMEAVDPLTVGPGVEGEITARAWGGPVPTNEPWVSP